MNKAPILTGSRVISKAGRDAGGEFIVIKSLDEAYVLIVDGDKHKMAKPKKKKRRHLKQISQPTPEIANRLRDSHPVYDYEVRRWLSHEEG